MIAIDTTFLVDLEIMESPRHQQAYKFFQEWRAEENSILVIHNHVFNEFLHIVTDPKRFINPIPMEKAIDRCWFWIDQSRVKVVYSDDDSLRRSLLWMNMHGLGRKRISDTYMAAAYVHAGADTLITANPKDYEILNCFKVVDYSSKLC